MSGQSILGLATAAAGTNTQQAASTAFVTQAVSVGNTTGTASNITGVLNATSHPAHTGDVTGPSGSTALTLATVNANVGTFQGLTVNGKGLVTAAAAVVAPGCVIPLLQEFTPVTTTVTTSATALLINATQFLWDAGYLPAGRSLFLEILGSATAGSPTVILTPAGSAVASVTLIGTASTTTVRTRSAAITLVSGTVYETRLFNSVAGTASLRVARLIVI